MKENTLQVLKEIEDKVGCVFNWFSANYFKINPEKSHFLLTLNEEINLNLGDLIRKSLKNYWVKILTISLHLTNTFQIYAKKQAKNFMLLHVFQVI